ncbi:MAG: hypothetical protein ABEL76_08525, partial [Bradymonadaceae bacterium]
LEPEESEKGRESSGPGRGTRDARLIAALQTARGVTMAARAALLRVEVELIELMLDVLGEDETGDET